MIVVPLPAVRDCIFGFEVLRRMGFSADDIYCAWGNAPDGPCAFVVLRTQGREWTWMIAPIDMDGEELMRQYREACEAWNALDPTADPWGFDRSVIKGMSMVAVRSVQAKGIRVPLFDEMAGP